MRFSMPDAATSSACVQHPAQNNKAAVMVAVLRTLTARGSYTRQLVMTSDHGTLGLDWWCGSDKATWAAPDAPIVLFIHGINGEHAAAQHVSLLIASGQRCAGSVLSAAGRAAFALRGLGDCWKQGGAGRSRLSPVWQGGSV